MPKKDRKKMYTVLLGLFFIGTMVLSILGFSGGGIDPNVQGSETTYGGRKFAQTEGRWITYLEDETPITIAVNPDQLQSYENLDLSIFEGRQKVYLSAPPTGDLAQAVAYLKSRINQFKTTVLSCEKDNLGCENLPLKTCKDATKEIGVVIIREGSTTKLEKEPNCLIIETTFIDLVGMTDKLVLESIGIIERK